MRTTQEEKLIQSLWVALVGQDWLTITALLDSLSDPSIGDSTKAIGICLARSFSFVSQRPAALALSIEPSVTGKQDEAELRELLDPAPATGAKTLINRIHRILQIYGDI